MTNKERINTMDDTELAMLLADGCVTGKSCLTAPTFRGTEIQNCYACVKRWLKEEAEPPEEAMKRRKMRKYALEMFG